MWAVHKLIPVWQFAIPFQENTGLLLVVAGFLMTFSGVWSFRKAVTTVDPMHPEKANKLVTSGIYRLTRNPMYVGMLLVLLAWFVYLGSAINLLIVCLFVWFIDRYQIQPEEKALQQLFGEDFTRYCNATRRWL